MSAPPLVEASAPGKLFLIGEYAVLEGAPALLTAVDRRARVALYPSPDARWRLTAPNLAIHALELDEDGEPAPDIDAELADRLRVFRAVRRHVSAYLDDRRLPPLHAHIDTSEFARDGHKLGLGSSAAVAAALAGALLAAAGIYPERAELTRLAVAAHRDAQDGTGSGGDVATAIYGGVLSYIRDREPRPLTWPSGLTGRIVVTGQGARTPELVRRVYAYRDADPHGFADDMARLTALAESVEDTMNQHSRFTQLARVYFDALTALDEHANAGIISPRHRELHALAQRHGSVFKSSGAGGGDVGLLFTLPGVDDTGLARDFSTAGAEILPIVMGAPGVSIAAGDRLGTDDRAIGRELN